MAGVKGRSGGARANTQKLRRVGSVRWQREQRRGKSAPVRPASRQAAAVDAPLDLPKGQRAVWDMLAPHAMAAGTLTGATVFAFIELCEAIVLKRDVARILESEGLTTYAIKTRMEQDGSGEQVGETKAHPLLSRYAVLLVRVEAGLTRFRLAPMGKPMEVPADEPADEFAAFESQPLRAVK